MVTGGRYATARRARPTRRTAGLAAIVTVVFAASLLTFSHGRINLDVTRLDLDVYRLGARAWLSGTAVYGQLPSVQSGLDLGFTYPPISAVAMVPLAVVPARIAGIIMTGLTIGLLLAVVALFLRTAGLVPDQRTAWRRAAALSPLAVLIEPVRTTLAFGQINVVLMALVAFDCLLPRTRWPRGVLVGVAAALKLTPAVFVLYFVATRQYRAAVWSVVSLAAVTGIGFLLAPHDSVRYWTNTVFQTGRVGSQSFFDNQSLTGVFSRLGLTGHAFSLVWLAACALVAVMGFVAIRLTTGEGSAGAPNQSPADDDAPQPDAPQYAAMRPMLLPLLLTACVTLCVSPIAWSHHWVWASPALLTAAALAWRARDRRQLWLVAGALVMFVGFPASWFPRSGNVEVHWAWWQQILGSAYVFVAVGLLGYFASVALIRRRRTPVTRPTSSSSAAQPFPTSDTRDRVQAGPSQASR